MVSVGHFVSKENNGKTKFLSAKAKRVQIRRVSVQIFSLLMPVNYNQDLNPVSAA